MPRDPSLSLLLVAYFEASDRYCEAVDEMCRLADRGKHLEFANIAARVRKQEVEVEMARAAMSKYMREASASALGIGRPILGGIIPEDLEQSKE